MEVPGFIVFVVIGIITLVIVGLVTGLVVVVNAKKVITDMENVADYNSFVDTLSVSDNDKEHLKSKYSNVYNGLTNCDANLKECEAGTCPACNSCCPAPPACNSCCESTQCPEPESCPPCNNNNNTSSSKFNNVGMIVGIVFGAVVLFVGGLYVTTRRRDKPLPALPELGQAIPGNPAYTAAYQSAARAANRDTAGLSGRRPFEKYRGTRLLTEQPPSSRPPLMRQSNVKFSNGTWGPLSTPTAGIPVRVTKTVPFPSRNESGGFYPAVLSM